MRRFRSFFQKFFSKKIFKKIFKNFFCFQSRKVIFQSYRAWKAHFGCLESVFKAFHEYILGIFRKLSFLSLRYSADFRRSRLVYHYRRLNDHLFDEDKRFAQKLYLFAHSIALMRLGCFYMLHLVCVLRRSFLDHFSVLSDQVKSLSVSVKFYPLFSRGGTLAIAWSWCKAVVVFRSDLLQLLFHERGNQDMLYDRIGAGGFPKRRIFKVP